MEFRYYVGLLWKWSWLILLCGLMAGIASFYAFRTWTVWPYYQAKATIRVGDDASGSDFDFQTLQAIRETYVEIGGRPPITNEVIAKFGLPMDSNEFKRRLDLIPIGETQLIEIEVTYNQPETTAAIANDLAQRLIDSSRTNRNSSVQVQLVTPAAVPTRTSLSSYLGILVAGLLGATASIGIIAVLELFKDKFESVYEVERITGLPVLIDLSLPRSVRRLFFGRRETLDVDRLQAVVDNSRWVRLKLGRFNGSSGQAILLAGPGPVEDIDIIARGLATAWSDSNAWSVIVDSQLDMLESSGVWFSEEEGAKKCSAYTKSGNPCSRTANNGSSFCKQHAAVALPAVSGAIPADLNLKVKEHPSERLIEPLVEQPNGFNGNGAIVVEKNRYKSIETIQEELNALKNRNHIVIVQGSSVLDQADNAIVGSQVDDTLLLIRRGKTSVDNTKKAIQILQQVGGTISGIIFIR